MEAGSSSSPPVSSAVNADQKHGLFLSFNGKDIRFSFLSHLEEALCQQGIPAFIKSEESETTDDEETKISTVIQESKVSVVIFSENYLSSRGCLNEVAKIMDCYEQPEQQQVLPVFYHVHPDDVGSQSGIYEEAFARVVKDYKIKTEVAAGWRKALEQAAKLKLPELVLRVQKSVGSGEDSDQDQPSFAKFESELVRKIVKFVSEKLGYRYLDELKDPDELQAQIQHIRRDRVFLSCREPDTRNNFVSQVYDALCVRGIPTFIDSDQSLKGRTIATILTEIEQSNVSIPVLSPHYAYSTRCLEELAKIIECMRTKKQLVLPVFYHVDPDKVAKQTGSFKKAFDKHVKNYKDNESLVKKWRNAMTAVANVSGWVIKKNSSESEVVKRISEIIDSHLHYIYDDLVGGHPRVRQIQTVSCFGKPEIRIIGIRGDSGTGKTSLAGHLYSRFSINFETSVFLTKVTEEMMRRNGPSRLQGTLQSGTIDRDRPKKVLIVLDDINRFEDFIRLVGTRNQFGAGSRIIVTSTKKDLLDSIVDFGCIHEVSVLRSYEIFELFSLFAFEDGLPKPPCLDLTHEVVNLVEGNPLAIKVLGLFLYGKSRQDWQAAVTKLKTTPDVGKIQEMLRLSIDALEYNERESFLDIACFFNGKPKSHITRILDAYGYDSKSGLRILTQRFLITVYSSTVYMFAMIEEMGKKIVREECEAEPGKPSRLWDPNEISQVLQEKKGTENVEGISLDMSKIEELSVVSTVFEGMKKLKFLSFYGADTDQPKIHLPDPLTSLPSGLRYLQWNHYPRKSLPPKFSPKMLVELDMSCSSKLEQLWEGEQDLPNLHSLCLRNCNRLTEIPNLSKASSLQILDCEGCKNLVEVPPSISKCTRLARLILRRCSSIPRIEGTKSLRAFKTLDLSGCSVLATFPEVPEGMKELLMSGTAIKEVPASINGTAIKEAPASINYLPNLETLDLSNCKQLRYFSSQPLRSMISLQALDLSGSIYLTSIPESIQHLSRLRRLNIRGCEQLDTLPKLPGSLTYLDAEDCSALHTVEGFAPIEKYGARFNFTNCLKLNTESRRKILDLAKECLAAECPEKDEIQRVVFSVPGKDIPEWITSTCIGSSITKALPNNWLTDKFLGFALCAVLAPQDTNSRVGHGTLDSITWKVQFKPDVGLRSCMNEKVEDNELHESAHLYLFSSKQFDGEVNHGYKEATFDVIASSSEEKMIAVELLYAAGDEESSEAVEVTSHASAIS